MGGETEIVTAGRFIVYTADTTGLSAMPLLYAMALTVVVAPTENAALYSVPAVSLGFAPFVVYRIDAPAVVLTMVTDCAAA